MLCFGLIDERINSSHNEQPVVTDWLDSAVSSLDCGSPEVVDPGCGTGSQRRRLPTAEVS